MRTEHGSQPASLDPSTSSSVEERAAQFDFAPDDIAALEALGRSLIDDVSAMIDEFYEWALGTPAVRVHFHGIHDIPRIKLLQVEAWKLMLSRPLSAEAQQLSNQIGQAHAAIGLEPAEYARGFAQMQRCICARLVERGVSAQDLALFMRYCTIAMGETVQVYHAATSEIIAEQSRAIMDLATPVTDLWDDILMLPVVGIIDSSRAHQIMTTVLERIAELRSRVVIVDISGVPVVDTAVAAHLIRFAKATALMGSRCIVSGVSPAIAQTIVELGVDVDALTTRGSLVDAFDAGLKYTGRKIVDAAGAS